MDVDIGENRIGWSPFTLFHEHAGGALQTVSAMERAMAKACEGDDALAGIEETSALELRADEIKNELRARLGGPIKLAIHRRRCSPCCSARTGSPTTPWT